MNENNRVLNKLEEYDDAITGLEDYLRRRIVKIVPHPNNDEILCFLGTLMAKLILSFSYVEADDCDKCKQDLICNAILNNYIETILKVMHKHD